MPRSHARPIKLESLGVTAGICIYIQLTLEQHGLNCTDPLVHGFFSINMFCTINRFSLTYDFLNIFFSLAYFIIRIQYIMHIAYKLCVNQLLVLSVRLLVNSRLLIVLGSQSHKWIFNCMRVGIPNSHVVQGSVVFLKLLDDTLIFYLGCKVRPRKRPGKVKLKRS